MSDEPLALLYLYLSCKNHSNTSGSSDIGGIYRIGKGTATPVVHLT
jgi:hypothetical protein